MASWNLDCAYCHKHFRYSEIEDTLTNRYLPAKPVFPEDGAAFQCPHCGHKATYQQHQLTYRD
jgi:DNA-directed RNA polymerase subunit RPC12/RpoP